MTWLNFALRATSPLTWPGLVFLGAFALQVGRRPEAILRPQFYAEGGPIFYLPAFFAEPVSLFLAPYAGYLHIVPRTLAYAERLGSPDLAPMIGSIASFLIVGGIAAFIASERLSNVLPALWQRLALASVLILSPSVHEVLGVEVNVQVYLAVFLVVLAIARPPATRLGNAVDIAAAAAAGLSGPFAILFAPLFWLRRDWLAAVVTGCALIQLGVILVAPQRPIALPNIGVIVDVSALRVNAAVFGPTLGSVAPRWIAAVLVVIGTAIAFRAPHRTLWLALGYGAVVVAGSGFVSDGAGLAIHARWGERFFLLASVAVGALVIAGLSSDDRFVARLSRVLGVLLVIGLTVDFRVPAFRDVAWADNNACIGAMESCVIPGEPEPFAIHWPGMNGPFEIPTIRPTDP